MDDSDDPACPACGGVGILLGTMRLWHYRCRACGLNFDHDAPASTPAPATPAKLTRELAIRIIMREETLGSSCDVYETTRLEALRKEMQTWPMERLELAAHDTFAWQLISQGEDPEEVLRDPAY